MKVLVIQPHYDDAVFAMGARIFAHVEEGHDVHVLTVFSGSGTMRNDVIPHWVRQHNEICWDHTFEDPFSTGPLFDHLSDTLDEAGYPNPLMPEHIVVMRRAQDEVALKSLGVKSLCPQPAGLQIAEAAYRVVPNGGAMYPLQGALHRPPFLEDVMRTAPLVREVIATTLNYLEPIWVYFPAGTSTHVDHTLVRDAAVHIIATRKAQEVHKATATYSLAYRDFSAEDEVRPVVSEYHFARSTMSDEALVAKVQAVLLEKAQNFLIGPGEARIFAKLKKDGEKFRPHSHSLVPVVSLEKG